MNLSFHSAAVNRNCELLALRHGFIGVDYSPRVPDFQKDAAIALQPTGGGRLDMDHVQAIKLLLHKPRLWKGEARQWPAEDLGKIDLIAENQLIETKGCIS